MSQSTASETVEALRATFHSGRTRPIAWRVAQLEAMRTLLKEREAELFDALRADLGKSDFEAYATETGFVKAEIEHTLKHLGEWMRPRRVATPLANQLGTSTIVPEPLGVALIIGTWNYPVQLLLAPAIGAIAAGNCAILKPSELAPTTSATKRSAARRSVVRMPSVWPLPWLRMCSIAPSRPSTTTMSTIRSRNSQP